MKCFIEIPDKVKNPKELFPNAVGIIKYAFSIEDEKNQSTQYFEFDDYNNMANDRAFNALAFYKELSMSCTREYLMTFSQALDDIINHPKQLLITDIVKLNLQLKERLELLFEPDIAYKLCSVVFFDAKENPNRFEYKYAIEKADLFKKVPINDFFFHQPITKLVPYISSLSNDFHQYCQMVNLISQKHIDSISMMLSEASKKNASYKSLMSQITKELT